jgi:putative photosynthetic complex assembly protein 2
MVNSVILAIAYTVFIWWFSTGVILYLNGLPRWTFKWTMAAATVVLVAALIALGVSSRVEAPWAAYCAFTSAVLVWAWQEIGFLLGWVTGSRKSDCPTDAKGWRKFGLAAETILHHELALVMLALLVWWVTRDGPNQIGFWTYLVLWAMRQSAKLNVYFGVRNLNEEFLPRHLQYLHTYFTRRAINPFLPVSVLLACVAVAPLWRGVVVAPVAGFDAVGMTLVATLLSLAILEHLFLVLPLPFENLWRWGLRSRAAPLS